MSVNLSGHRDYIKSKLAALNKYGSRLDAVISWVMETKTRINISKDLPSEQDRKRVIDNIMVINYVFRRISLGNRYKY